MTLLPMLRRRGEAESPLLAMEKSMNELFGDFFRGWRLEPLMETYAEVPWAPRLDVAEDEKNVVVTAEIPGVDEKAIEVTYREGVLTLKGEKKEEKEEKKKNYHRVERTYGAFERRIPLPCMVEAEKITAAFKSGVLTVVAPKAPEAIKAAKKIEVRPS